MLAVGPGVAFMATLTIGERATSVALAASASPPSPSTPVLTYSDSGASHHYFRDRGDFVTYQPLSLSATGAGHFFPVAGQGLVVKAIVLDNRRVVRSFFALHAPTMHQNLISTLQFDREGCDIRTRRGINTIWSPEGYVILRSQPLEGVDMYVFTLLRPTAQELVSERLKLAPREPELHALSASQSKPVSFETWHRRFGHNGWDGLRRTPAVVEGMEVKGSRDHDTDIVCESCMAGRQSRRPFDEEVVRETEVGERIHIDLAGPISVRSLGGKEYVMGMTDGCSQFLEAAFLAGKSSMETAAAFSEFLGWFERTTGEEGEVCEDGWGHGVHGRVQGTRDSS